MADPAIRGLGLIRTFDDGTGVCGVDMSVEYGQIHALVGLNGAGKTTLLRLLLGMLQPDAGHVTVDGRSHKDIDWAAVGHLVESPLIYPELTCRQNLTLGARLHGATTSEAAAMAAAVMNELRLTQYSERRAAKLSLGNRRRLGLASALQHKPRLIILDEPTNALDPAAVIRLRETLQRQADSGTAILVSSHHLDEVARIASEISVLNAGRIIGTLEPAGVDIERAFFHLVLADDEACS